MSDPSHAYQSFVGIDIAAKTFTATWTPAGPTRPVTFEHTDEGYRGFMERMQAAQPNPAAVLIVMEATGSYWVASAVAFHQAGYHVAIVNPALIHNFAKSLARRAKTDALDAAVILQFACERQPRPWTPPPAVYHELRQRLVARDALMEMRQQARNQQHALEQWPIRVEAVVAQFQAVIVDLTARIDQLDGEIVQCLQDGAWAESARLLASIPGLGPTTSAWLLVATMNFQLCGSPEAAAAYVGLAPLQNESGTSLHGRSHISRGGHARLRKALYLATLSAARHNPMIRTFFTRLRLAGKPFKVAQCAAARKLLHLAWVVVTKREPFDPTYAQRSHVVNSVSAAGSPSS